MFRRARFLGIYAGCALACATAAAGQTVGHHERERFLYSICSVTGADFSRVVTARKTGYRMATVGITWGWDYDVNFTLVRN